MRGGGIRNSADHIKLLCNAMRGGGIWINADHIQLLCNAMRGGVYGSAQITFNCYVMQ